MPACRINRATRLREQRMPSSRSSAWIPQLAPSLELEGWFGNDSRRWAEFERRYRAELEGEQAARQLQLLDRIPGVSPVLLLYSAGDREHNAAVVLRKVLAERKFVSELPRGA